MASPTDRQLPFELRLWQGEGGSTSFTTLDRLSLSPHDLEAPVQVIENLPLTLEWADGDENEELVIYWDELIGLEDEGGETVFAVSSMRPWYELARPGDEYPWRCGNYLFRVRAAGTFYYGAFEVVPRIGTGGQIAAIHETIERHVDGLVADYLAFRRTTAAESSAGLDLNRDWRFFTWYQTKHQPLLHALKQVEASAELELKPTYMRQQAPRRQTARSVRWQSSAQAVQHESVYLNRRMELHPDSAANQAVKWYVRDMLHRMQEAMSALRAEYAKYAEMCDRLSEQLERTRLRLDDMKRTKAITARDHQNVESTQRMEQVRLEQTTQHLRSIQSLERDFERYQTALRQVLYSPFWREVQDRQPRRIKLGRHPAYQSVYEIWSELREKSGKAGGAPQYLAAMPKPTAVLYEYYVFFKTVELLQLLGFRYDGDTLEEQLDRSVVREGLQDGAKVVVTRGPLAAEVTFNELVPAHDDEALLRGIPFFSMENKRKPDIRIDLYIHGTDGRRVFRSTLIIEVKYRPIWNIYSERGNTEAMLQMDKYYAMKYVERSGERKRYERHPVDVVICAYPGSAQHPAELEAGCGLFIAFYPDMPGEHDLSARLAEWVERHGGADGGTAISAFEGAINR